MKLIVYHGSDMIVEKPEFGIGKEHADFASGFYCSDDIEVTREWACVENMDGYVNRYEIDTEGLSILDLTSADYHHLNILALMLKCRGMAHRTRLANLGHEYLIENYLPNFEDYDIITGYRFDSAFYPFARAFATSEISLKQLKTIMNYNRFGNQIALKSERAFKAIRFIDSSPVDSSIYYPKYCARVEEVRAWCEQVRQSEDIYGLFMLDILREKIQNDDPRLR